jgi:hypothetical protein
MEADIYYMTNVGHEKDDMSYVHAKPIISHIELGERENYVIVDQTNVKTDDMEKASEKLFALYNGEANKRNPLSTKKKQEHLKQIGVGHTSMSVGDFIVFGEEKDHIFIVDMMGWKEVMPTRLWYKSLYFAPGCTSQCKSCREHQ